MTESVAGPRDPDRDSEWETGPGLERLVFFSDAVIAIAMTLLALDLPVPEGDSGRELWRSFASHLGRDYLTFVISFLVIARFWMVHHSFFHRVRAADARLVQLNLLYLMFIVILPFATRVLGDDGQYAFGTVVYAASVALVGLAFAAIASHCARAGLLRPLRPGERAHDTARGSLVTAAIFLLSVPIALWNADAAKWFWLALLLTGPSARLRLRLRRRDRRSAG